MTCLHFHSSSHNKTTKNKYIHTFLKSIIEERNNKKKNYDSKCKPLGNEMIVREQNIFYGLFGTYHSCYEHLGYFVHHMSIS